MDVLEKKPTCSKQHGLGVGEANQICQKDFGIPLKDYGASLSDKSLRTLLVEVEAIVISTPLTTDLLSDVNSLIPLSPINLLTMKSKVMMPPPAVFSTPDTSSCKHWRRVQHISNEFWD